MHELSIAMSLVEAASEEAQRHEGRVVAVHLKLGPLSGVIKEALLSAFELAREGSPLDESELRIEDVPLAAYCPQCQAEQPIPSLQYLCCPICETPLHEIVRGRELELTALEFKP